MWIGKRIKEKKENLKRYMKYTRSVIRGNTDEKEVLDYLDKL